jgi:hypothetical protein
VLQGLNDRLGYVFLGFISTIGFLDVMCLPRGPLAAGAAFFWCVAIAAPEIEYLIQCP